MQTKTPLDRFMEPLRQRGSSSTPIFSYPRHVHASEANSASDGHLKRDAKRDTPVTLSDALANRVRAFQEQVRAWTGSGIPLLTLPAAPEPQRGQCVSCGVSIATGWRCAVCMEAVCLALGVTPPHGAE